MDSEELKKRTKTFAINIINLVENLGKTKTGDVIGRQILKSATSIGANYRSACRAQSHAHFISKMNIVLEESDETVYWLELMSETGSAEESVLKRLLKEANELTAIFYASLITAKKNRAKY